VWLIADENERTKGAPTAVHGPLEMTYHSNEKTNVIADCLENLFTSHDLCDEKHERQLET
jgi:hypothetical protein